MSQLFKSGSSRRRSTRKLASHIPAEIQRPETRQLLTVIGLTNPTEFSTAENQVAEDSLSPNSFSSESFGEQVFEQVSSEEVPTIEFKDGRLEVNGTSFADQIIIRPVGTDGNQIRVSIRNLDLGTETNFDSLGWMQIEGITVRAGGGDDSIYNLTNIPEFIDAGAGDDYVLAGVGNSIIDGGSGDDVLNGRLGSDALFGGDGNDYSTAEEAMTW